MDCQVKLEIFEGPLDLLIHLIRKNEVDIYDIPMATITDQYLEYLELMKNFNLQLAGEFLVMAATLIQIKSRLLLPAESTDEAGTEDPRLEIALPLLEYMRFKEAAGKLENRDLLERDVFVRDFMPPEWKEMEPQEMTFRVTLFDLVDAFQKMIDRAREEDFMVLAREELTLGARMEEIHHYLITRSPRRLEELFPETFSRTLVVVTFLALLEMARQGRITLVQAWHQDTLLIVLKPPQSPGEPDPNRVPSHENGPTQTLN